jgi:very-short-patch-repair endonuclease
MGISSNKENFIIYAQKKHSNKYDYSKVVYIGNKNKIIIICPQHGEFLQRPNDHLTGYGCKKCQYEKTSKENKFTNEIFIEKANKIHDNKYDYTLIKYNGYENKIIIICKKHGNFQQSPHAHLSGAGCPICKESLGEKKVAEILLKNKIKFEREKTFNDLKDKSNLFYDFYLPEHRTFIEYHGIQHRQSIDFFGGRNAYIERRKRDIIKLRYAINNKYLLMSIYDIPIKDMDELFVNALKYKSII